MVTSLRKHSLGYFSWVLLFEIFYLCFTVLKQTILFIIPEMFRFVNLWLDWRTHKCSKFWTFFHIACFSGKMYCGKIFILRITLSPLTAHAEYKQRAGERGSVPDWLSRSGTAIPFVQSEAGLTSAALLRSYGRGIKGESAETGIHYFRSNHEVK